MFLSKIWFVLVGLVAGVALSIAFLAPKPAQRRIEQLQGQRLDRAQYAAEQMLKTDARRWIDYVAKLGRDAVIVDALDAASRGAGELKMLNQTVSNRARQLVPDMEGIGLELLVATDDKGRVVARVGRSESQFGDNIEGLEVVADALRGYLSDDVWGSEGKLMRLAGAPVLAKTRDRIVGALYVGAEAGKRLATVWKNNLGVEIGILLGKTVVASTLPDALLDPMPDRIVEHAKEIAEARRTRPITLEAGADRMLAVAAPFVGQAEAQDAYYVLVSKMDPMTGPWSMLADTTKDDLRWGQFPWLPLGLGLIAILGIGLALQFVEVERPLSELRHEVQRLAKGNVEKLNDRQYRAKFGGIARDVNATLERFTHAPTAKSETAKRDINAILSGGDGLGGAADASDAPLSSPLLGGPSLGAPLAGPPGFAPPSFGAAPAAPSPFAASPGPAGPPPASFFGGPAAVTPPPAAIPAATMMGMGAPPPAAPGFGGPGSPFASPVSPYAAPQQSLAPQPQSPFAPPPSPFAPPAFGSPQPGAFTAPPPPAAPFLPAQPAMIEAPPSPFGTPPAVSYATPPPVEDDMPTPPAEPAAAPDPDDDHFGEVYDEYLKTRKRCGESLQGLSLEKFRQKLIANREQIVQKYGCRGARFSVYVKDGKAAIKASPLK